MTFIPLDTVDVSPINESYRFVAPTLIAIIAIPVLFYPSK